MDLSISKTDKHTNKAIFIVLLFIIFIFTGCNNSALIMYTPTPQPEITPHATPEITQNNSFITNNSNLNISGSKEYNTSYPLPDVIGNTGANINNGGLCVYDDNRVYYIDNGIYSMTSDGVDKIQILDMANISCLNSVGEHLYFISNHDGEIYRVKKQENAQPEHMLISGVKSLVVIGDNMYYSCGLCENNANMIYRTGVGGTNQECLFFRANELYPDNNYIYFDNIEDDNKLYRYDTISNEIIKLSDDKASQINIVNEQIYYISEKSSYNVVRMDRNGENTLVVVSEPCSSLNSKGSTLLYTPEKNGYIKSYNIITGETQTILEYEGVDGLSIADTIIFFETIIVKGQEISTYYYNLKNNEVNKPLPQKLSGHIKSIDTENKRITIELVDIYENQAAIERYAKDNAITIEQAREEIYNKQGTYYIPCQARATQTYNYVDWTKVVQKRRASSLNVSTPYTSDVMSIVEMYESNSLLADKLVYDFIILDNEILEIDEFYYPVDFYN